MHSLKAAGGLPGYFLEEIRPLVYNQAVADVQERLQARIAELDIESHEDEFTYWQVPTGITSMNLRDVMHGSFKVVGDTSLKMFTVHIVDKGQPLYDYQK